MWLFFNDAMLSIVQKPDDKDTLTVRGRIKGDIEAVFPDVEVTEGDGTDYRFRAKVPREIVARVIAARVMALDYSNFKSSVKDSTRHDTYANCWNTLYRWQEQSGAPHKFWTK